MKLSLLLILFLSLTSVSYSDPQPRYIYNEDYTIKTDTRTGARYGQTNLQIKATSRSIKYIYTFADRKKTTIRGTAISNNYNEDFSKKTVTYNVNGEEVDKIFDKTKTTSKWDKNNIRFNNTYFYSDKSKTTSTSRVNNFINWDALGSTFGVGSSNQTNFYLPITEDTVSELVTSVDNFYEVSDLAWYWNVKNSRHVYLALSSDTLNKTTIYNRMRALDYNFLYTDLLYFDDSRNTAWGVNGNGYAIIVNDDDLNFVAHGIWSFSTNCPVRGCAKNFGNMNVYVGGGAFGYETPHGNIPSSGTKRFTGDTIGAYTNEFGKSYFVSAFFTADTNFGTREIDISTSGTFARDLITDVTGSNSNLNWSGSMSYAAGSNNLSGTGVTDDGQLSGDLKGKFYGGAANEIGGTWAFTGTGNRRYGGAFAGK